MGVPGTRALYFVSTGEQAGHRATSGAQSQISSGQHQRLADSQVLPQLLEGIPEEIKQVSGDGAWESRSCDLGQEPRSRPLGIARECLIPVTGTCAGFCKVGRAKSKCQSGYHPLLPKPPCFASRGSLVANCSGRNFGNQAAELFVQCAALNPVIALCKLQSYGAESQASTVDGRKLTIHEFVQQSHS